MVRCTDQVLFNEVGLISYPPQRGRTVRRKVRGAQRSVVKPDSARSSGTPSEVLVRCVGCNAPDESLKITTKHIRYIGNYI